MRVQSRIEMLEELLGSRGPAVIVVVQNEDGTWPPDPPEDAARVVVRVHLQGIPSDGDAEQVAW
jgi:hypothetical protein